MEEINYCPCCGNQEKDFFLARRSIVAPFIADYVLSEKSVLFCTLLKCKKCGFIFFDKRFSESEVKRLYGTYRQDDYFKNRNNYEFYYTRKINESFDDINFKKELIYDFIKDIDIDFKTFGNILDYGGDRGQFFPSCFDNSTKWLYDLSGYDPVENVNKIKELKLDKIGFFDLILISHLLEHISYPESFLLHIKSFVKNGGHIYIELPYEEFKFMSNNFNFFEKFISVISKSNPLMILFDVYSLFFRLRFKFVPFCGVVKLHEHINFFNLNSLNALLNKSGFKVVKIELKKIGYQKSGRDCVIQCLASKIF